MLSTILQWNCCMHTCDNTLIQNICSLRCGHLSELQKTWIASQSTEFFVTLMMAEVLSEWSILKVVIAKKIANCTIESQLVHFLLHMSKISPTGVLKHHASGYKWFISQCCSSYCITVVDVMIILHITTCWMITWWV